MQPLTAYLNLAMSLPCLYQTQTGKLAQFNKRDREHGPELSEDISEISAFGVVTQVRGPSPGQKAVMKIKIQ